MLFGHNELNEWNARFSEQDALQKGIEEKSREIAEKGNEIYAEA